MLCNAVKKHNVEADVCSIGLASLPVRLEIAHLPFLLLDFS